MRIRVAVPEEHVSAPVIDAALEAVTRLDESLIRSGQSPTSHELISQGARWRPENMGDEHFDHGGTIAARGWGDCDDWAPLHAATLRAEGSDPGARAVVYPSGPSTFHAVVQRSDGTIEDPSAAAGMPTKSKVVGESIEVYACDPHDGRVYQGQLLPTVGPLSMHCGPQLSVRGCKVIGGQTLFEGRCDMPMSGSPLVGVRHRRKFRRVVGGVVPYSFSCTGFGMSAREALNSAIKGAVLCGDASDHVTALDRYKLLAKQAALTNMPHVAIHQSLVDRILADIHEEAERHQAHPQYFLDHLASELMAQGHDTRPNALDIADAIARNAAYG